MAEIDETQDVELPADNDDSLPVDISNDAPIDDAPNIEELQDQIQLLQQRAALIDEFERDPYGVMTRVAGQLGMDLVQRNSQGNNGAPSNGIAPNNPSSNNGHGSPPQDYIDSVKQSMSPEMQFLGEELARSSWIATQNALEPLKQQMQQERAQTQSQERDRLAAEMDAQHPEWRTKVSDMESLFDFIQRAGSGGAMSHPKFGSLQSVLFKLVNGENGAAATAASRMRDAARNATTNASSPAPAQIDLGQLIRDAPTREKQIEIAWKDAMARHAPADT